MIFVVLKKSAFNYYLFNTRKIFLSAETTDETDVIDATNEIYKVSSNILATDSMTDCNLVEDEMIEF